jgi:FkbM family methyltransferase
VPATLLKEANHGRELIGPDGFLRIPPSVRRVWIDVGAHFLETTSEELKYEDVAVVAIEPLKEAWGRWPNSDRVIGLPVAIYLDRGTMDFHVNRVDETSSLLEGAEGSSVTKTVEVRKVPVIRLEDVLKAIPVRYTVSYVKTDVQGVDLQVLQSGGNSLTRAERIRAEIIHSPEYKKLDGRGMSTDAEMKAYLAGLGFVLENETNVQRGRAWLDANFVNARRSLFDRAWQDLRFGVPTS